MKSITNILSVPTNLRLEVVLPMIGFLVPLMVSGPQILTGIAVNTLLVLFALRYSEKSSFTMCASPSLGAVGNGLVFGTVTPFLLFFVPFIWVSNMTLVAIVHMGRKTNPMAGIVIGAFIKASMLFIVASAFVSLHIVPPIFLTVMGAMQFGTALIGGIIALGILRVTKLSHGGN